MHTNVGILKLGTKNWDICAKNTGCRERNRKENCGFAICPNCLSFDFKYYEITISSIIHLIITYIKNGHFTSKFHV